MNAAALLALALLAPPAAARDEDEEKPIAPAPPRAEGEGPFARLILRGVTLIDGTGAPAVGPVDLVIEQDRIREVKVVGAPGVAIDLKKPGGVAPKKPCLSVRPHQRSVCWLKSKNVTAWRSITMWRVWWIVSCVACRWHQSCVCVRPKAALRFAKPLPPRSAKNAMAGSGKVRA